MSGRRSWTRVSRLAIGVVFLLAGTSLVVYFSQMRTSYIEMENQSTVSLYGSENVVLNDTNPVFYREVGILGGNDQVHVSYNCTSGGIYLGLIEKPEWETLAQLSTNQQIARLPLVANDLRNISASFRPITIAGRITSLIQRVSNETTLLPKGRISGVIEILFAAKSAGGELACAINWEALTFPNRDKFSVQIAQADSQINNGYISMSVGAIVLGLPELYEYSKKKRASESRSSA